MGVYVDHHPGREMVNVTASYLDGYMDPKLHGMIDNLHRSNVEIKIIHDVVNKLSHAKSKDPKEKDKLIDFSQDETMMRYMAHIHRSNPSIFDDLVQGVPDHLPKVGKVGALGQQISSDDLLNESLKDIHMGNVEIKSFSQDQIDAILQGLDGETKKHSADLNESLMHINEHYDKQSQVIEIARQIVKQANDLLESINRKMVR